ncbi:D-amino-acid transaminase [Virgibacillus halodenitrificans]|jgi:D-alanine transaminase|uniref:D-amino-acid transaminase n=1 Tax=Virgibacillus halodenitrificans TaxID=1482 RepID=UPI000310D104|nr:D-amino-acid transaminase [Virgibacillus halodenitrificans]MCJ0932340.1 D-amino-acid transaminase [Virgibacillus halodenitrificans]MEC2160643.1 D-amino-acid transaminase [Virgibacillus halodenitrificans]WHX24806.1 D-amino-acid transaminase [Virgibacillus halodenitrificans]
MSVYPIILAQDKFTHRDELNYPYEERGLQFGDGVYEVIRIYNGDYYLLNEHVDRLFRSAEAIKINLSLTKDELKKLLLELLTKNKMTADGKVYLQVSRGSAPRDHVFPLNVPANMYAYLQDLPRNLENLENGVCTITQRDVRWENCYIKSLNLLPNVLAKQEAKEQGCYEAILHRDGLVTECSSSNAYLVKDGKIHTHPATNNILHGCVRMRVEKFANDLNIPFIEEGFSVEDIAMADEIFLSSSTSEVMPVIKVDNKAINDGKPGTITRKLQDAYIADANITSEDALKPSV